MSEEKKFELNKVKKFDSIKQMLEMAVKEAGNKVAFKYKENNKVKEITFSEFEKDTEYLGTALASIKMHESNIAIVGENSYKWIVVYLTVLKSNGVFVPIDKELPLKDMLNVIDNSDSEVLFFSSRYKKYLESFKNELPKIKYFICLDDIDDENVLSYNGFLKIGKDLIEDGDMTYTAIDHTEEEEQKLKMLVYTSGTTGMAKGVMLSEHNLISSIYYGLQVSTVYDRCLSVLPYNHTYEAVSGLLVSIHHHATICINDSLKNILKNIQLYKPDYIYLVPAFIELFYKKIWSNVKESHKSIGLKVLCKYSNMLMKMGIDKRKKLFKSIHDVFGGNLRKIVIGGAALRKEVGEFFNTIGIDLIQGYGITECSPLVSANNDKYHNDCTTVGFPLPCCQIDIINKDSDGIGEICVKGDVVMMGYYKQPELTKEVLSDDGWFNTGDVGYLNKLGQIVITGRKKNLIVLENGKNVFPEEIENYILRIPYVLEVIVKSIKNNNGEEVGLCAEVFLSDDKLKEMGIIKENIAKKLKSDIAVELRSLPSYKHINEVEIRDKEFDKTTTNKIKRDYISK